MSFVPFRDRFPKIAEREVRTLTVVRSLDNGLPPGEYTFMEMFCDEPGCDCRRVFFYVVSSRLEGLEAVIAYGWEDLAFYDRWLTMSSPELVAELKGPVLNLGSPRSEYAEQILEAFEQLLLPDQAYIDRVQRHYAMFRAEIDGETGKKTRFDSRQQKLERARAKKKRQQLRKNRRRAR